MFGSNEHADSAGQSWSGRSFEPNAFAADDGSTPVAFAEAIAHFRSLAEDDTTRAAAHAAVVDAVRVSRFLIPLIAEVGDEGVSPAGLRVDKTQELAVVHVEGPDGQTVLPIFSSVAAMTAWRADARPVPADGLRAAASALLDDCSWVVVDATSDTEIVLRRPTLRAIAAEQPWTPPHADPDVVAAVHTATSSDGRINDFTLVSGDPDAHGFGHDLVIRLTLALRMAPDDLTQLLADLRRRLGQSELLAERVDNLLVQVVPRQN
ncbi:MAG: SseB family protein [Actinobacteria bacterium]|uniref:Unannotated protein n=1 Tax=freshwater metagenome TaxID=449393 RepID=A0A6J7FM94_9ZZZZ|nr:SseB family protein [Actinomycetota bacterium]